MTDHTALRILSSPQDASFGGEYIAPRRILEWIDKAGYACAVGWAGMYCVTAYVGNIHFDRPISVGAMIDVHARIIATGRTSMQVLVTVSASDITGGEPEQLVDCLLVFVAIDENHNPAAIEQWMPETGLDRQLNKSAVERLAARQAIRDLMLSQTYSDRGTTPRSTLRFLASPGDSNWGGKAHGGTVMGWINEGAYSVAASWSSINAVAIYSGGIHFLKPIEIGSIVEIDSRLICVDGTHMHIATRVSSAPATNPQALTLTTVCMSIFIDPDRLGNPQPVKPLPLHSDEDVRLEAHARELIAMRDRIAELPI